jgi:hypothetical protein
LSLVNSNLAFRACPTPLSTEVLISNCSNFHSTRTAFKNYDYFAVDNMGKRIDDLEKSIADLMQQAGLDEQAAAQAAAGQATH